MSVWQLQKAMVLHPCVSPTTQKLPKLTYCRQAYVYVAWKDPPELWFIYEEQRGRKVEINAIRHSPRLCICWHVSCIGFSARKNCLLPNSTIWRPSAQMFCNSVISHGTRALEIDPSTWTATFLPLNGVTAAAVFVRAGECFWTSFISERLLLPCHIELSSSMKCISTSPSVSSAETSLEYSGTPLLSFSFVWCQWSTLVQVKTASKFVWVALLVSGYACLFILVRFVTLWI